MAEDPRELIRSAQAAELARDLVGAAGLLRRAAELYRQQGAELQAERVARHADRLSSPRAAPAHPGSASPASEVPAPEASGAGAEPHAGVSTVGRTGQRTLPERGPELADPSVEAWCSFCCQPSTEVGRLVTGPTGAFICADCVAHAGTSLGTTDKPPRAPEGRVGEEALEGAFLFPAHREATAQIERALGSGLRRVLLLGPPGVGKARVLDALRSECPRGSSQRAPVLLTEHALVVEGDPKTLRALERGAFVLASAGVLRARLSVVGEAARVALPTTVELAEATGTRLPFALLESIQAVVQLRATTEAELIDAAGQLLATATPTRQGSEQLVQTLVAQALASGRAVHELEALLRRLPPGGWALTEEEP